MHNNISTNKGKDLLEVVFGTDFTFSSCYNRRGINLKQKNVRKTQAIACKDFIWACVKLVSVPFGVYKFLSGNIYVVTTVHTT